VKAHRSLESRIAFKKHLLVIPAAIVFSVGTVAPIFLGFFFSLTDWNGLTETMNFIGLGNYRELFAEERFWNSLGFTLRFVVWNTLIQNLLALGFALFLDQKLKGRNLLRAIIFIPALLSPIIIGYLWGVLFTTIIPGVLKAAFGITGFNILGLPERVLSGLLVINNWQWVGYWMMIYLAALQSVPAELYESATIDGAGAVRKFFSVTLPLIGPAITVCLVSITLGGFQVYELILTATQGGPGHSSESFVMYIYNMAFSAQMPGFASANSIVFIFILLAVAAVQIRSLKKMEVQL